MVRKRKTGRPAHKPTAETRRQVEFVYGGGMTEDDVAVVIGITRPTLVKYYGAELGRGRAKMNAVVMGALYKAARNGNITAQIFWLKCRAGWKEPQVVQLEGNLRISTTEFIKSMGNGQPTQTGEADGDGDVADS